MWSRWTRRRAPGLAAQVLLLQVAVLLVVLAVSSVVSLRQADAEFRDSRAQRLTAAAEALAGTPAVQDGLDSPELRRAALVFYAQQRADDVGASVVHLVGRDGRVLVSTDPTREGQRADLGPGDALEGRRWTGDVRDRGAAALAATVPVLSDNAPDEDDALALGTGEPAPAGSVVGAVVVVEDFPPWRERLAGALGDLVVFLGLGLSLGVAGSILLSRLIRRRTRGLEPAEIAALADQREALLTSLREGLLALDADERVVLVNESAQTLLGLPAAAGGRGVRDLGLPERVVDLVTSTRDVVDEPVVVGGRLLVLNRAPVSSGGSVTTLRDRTELSALQSRLSARESLTDTLRAQTHEFANQLHTLSGLLQLGEPDEAARLIGTLTRRQAAISDAVRSRVEDPALAALLVAKTSQADERRADLVLDEDSAVPRLDADLAADAGTVLGNLLDNALDAAAGADPAARGRVTVRLVLDGDGPERALVVQVGDTGPGVAADDVADLFRRGWSTKPSDASGRGVGLALVQLVCERRGGSVSVRRGPGAVFTARLPLAEGAR